MATENLEQIIVPEDLPPSLSKRKLSAIGGFIEEGLSEEEACIMVGFSPVLFKELKQKNEGIHIFLEKKKIEFKRAHLKTIATKSSDKNSMWILEHLRPDEFGSKRNSGNTTVNVIGAIIKDIQKNNDGIEVTQDGTIGAESTKEITVESILA